MTIRAEFTLFSILLVWYNGKQGRKTHPLQKTKGQGAMELPKRKPNRLSDYDYNQQGAYFCHRLHQGQKTDFIPNRRGRVSRPETCRDDRRKNDRTDPRKISVGDCG